MPFNLFQLDTPANIHKHYWVRPAGSNQPWRHVYGGPIIPGMDQYIRTSAKVFGDEAVACRYSLDGQLIPPCSWIHHPGSVL